MSINTILDMTSVIRNSFYIKIGILIKADKIGVYDSNQFFTHSHVEKLHGSLFSDLAQVWQRPDRLVWKF